MERRRVARMSALNGGKKIDVMCPEKSLLAKQGWQVLVRRDRRRRALWSAARSVRVRGGRPPRNFASPRATQPRDTIPGADLWMRTSSKFVLLCLSQATAGRSTSSTRHNHGAM